MNEQNSLIKAILQQNLVMPKPRPLPKVGLASVLPNPTIRIKPKVFVSFDYENDAHFKRLLEAWSSNTRFLFTFQDKTPQEIQSEDVGRIKAVLSTKVQQASHTLVLVGKYANQLHLDSAKIGCRNWINFEIQQSRLHNKKIVAVKLEPNNELPERLYGSNALLVNGFNQASIIKALSEARNAS